jgi:hypothetical protein
MKFAVFDLGSRSFPPLAAGGNLVRVVRDRVILDLGMSIAAGGDAGPTETRGPATPRPEAPAR